MASRAKYISIFLMSVAFTAALIVVKPALVSAQSVTTAKEGLQISPALIQMEGTKGGSYNVNVKVTNVTVQSQTYYTSVSDFNSKDEKGTANLLIDNTLPDTASIRTWLSTVSQFTLASGVSKTLSVDVNIPTNAEAGGHYGALVFSGTAPTPESVGVGLTAGAGALFLIKVDGAINENASLAGFYAAPNSGDNASAFFEKAPITFVTRIKNSGNIHLQPSGQILVHDTFGNLTATIPVNDQKANVLPSSIRRFDTTMNLPWLFGHYTADLALGYGSNGQAITATISFWVIPYKIVGAVLLVLVTVIFILVRLVKVYNKRIITKAIQKHEKNKTSHSNK